MKTVSSHIFSDIACSGFESGRIIFGLVVLPDIQHFHKQESVSTCKYKNEENTYNDTYTKRSLHIRNVAFTLDI